ncbi:MAG: hypothetical protein U0470_00190 [Anaerolineae bacterium]
MADIVVRRCEGGGLPDQLGLVEGRPAGPATVKVAGAIEPATPPDLPPAPGRPGTPPEPPGGGGYIQIDPRGPAMNIFDALPTFFTEDLNGDGVLDIGFGLADKTHVWLGGRDLGTRLVEDRSDRIFLGAGLGGSMANRTWRPTDLNGDGRRDLALTQLRTLATAKVDAAGNATFESSASEPIHVFARDRAADDVIDVSSDPADDIWSDARYTLWAFGDFNGDHVDDVMLGSPAASIDSEYRDLRAVHPALIRRPPRDARPIPAARTAGGREPRKPLAGNSGGFSAAARSPSPCARPGRAKRVPPSSWARDLLADLHPRPWGRSGAGVGVG